MGDDSERQGSDTVLHGQELEDLDLPPMFRGHDIEVPYTREQLAPTIKRLRDALDLDLGSATGTSQQRLAAAWTRIAELRLPRKAVPNAVLDEVERLVGIWDGYGQGGIARYAYSLSGAEVEREQRRLERMLEHTLAASADDFPLRLVQTE
jgi:hypothetical protein